MATVQREQVLDFDVPSDQVLAMLTDTDFYQRKYQSLGFDAIRCLDSSDDGEAFSVGYEYVAPADLPVPAWARRALPEQVRVRQTDRWHRAGAEGSIHIKLQGVPVDIALDMRLDGRGGSCRNLLCWRFTCGLPLIGQRLAAFVADDVVGKAERDHQFVRREARDYPRDAA